MDKLIVALATGLYSGKIPFAPGTWGSAFALIPWYFCRGLSLANYLIVMAVLFVVVAQLSVYRNMRSINRVEALSLKE